MHSMSGQNRFYCVCMLFTTQICYLTVCLGYFLRMYGMWRHRAYRLLADTVCVRRRADPMWQSGCCDRADAKWRHKFHVLLIAANGLLTAGIQVLWGGQDHGDYAALYFAHGSEGGQDSPWRVLAWARRRQVRVSSSCVQIRPTDMTQLICPKEPTWTQTSPAYMTNQTCLHDKRDLLISQKRPTYITKEMRMWWPKRPTYMTKEMCMYIIYTRLHLL